ncbi:hypothetical chloroplast RF1 (chloroplast) [Bryopsis sp. KO-2023]|nr:hypothetical chloroplast RF1 [Bryopsis sp. KO-2023]
MSLAQEIKNYLEFFHTITDNQTNNFTFLTSTGILIKYNFLYIIQSIKNVLLYIFSLNWVFDFLQMPIYIPKWLSSNLKEIYSLHNPEDFIYSYSNVLSKYNINVKTLFIEGFFTSFFFCIPNSIIHFLALRRLIVEGIPAGISAACGTLSAQMLFLILILTGSRFFIFSWFNLEPFTYIFGIILVLLLVYNMAHTSIKRVRKEDTSNLIKIFLINFILVWTEQYGLFPYLSNLTFNQGASFFEIEILQNWLQILFYFLGFSIGTALWIFVFGFLFLRLSQYLAQILVQSYSQWIQKFNFICLTVIIAFCLASFPYYGIDYLLASPLGFYSEDTFLNSALLKTDIKDVSKGRLGEYSANSSIDTDIAPYDRGRYATGSEIELTFEDLNYQGEYIWRSRSDRVASGSAGIVNQFMSKFLPATKNLAASSEENLLEKIDPSISQEEIHSNSFYLYKENYENFLERFLTDYNSEVKDPSIPDTISESENFSAFSELVKYGFDSFASLEDVESDEFEEELGKKIKQKYYNNPIYKFLVTLDIQNFLRRQPNEYSLTENEENLLFEKRQILANYYNSLRSYTLLPYSETFQNLFGGTKTYANRVYNQQYKGTLKILRRLFLIDIDSKSTKKSSMSILKYDQPLFRNKKSNDNLFFHEELPANQINKTASSELSNFSLEEVYSIPFYIGWDSTLRKFILTNRLPMAQALFSKITTQNSVQFTAWPLNRLIFETNMQTSTGKFLFQKFNQSQSDLQRDLFEYAEPGDYETHLIYETLPSIVQRIDLRNKDKTNVDLRPTRGGFLWTKKQKFLSDSINN